MQCFINFLLPFSWHVLCDVQEMFAHLQEMTKDVQGRAEM